MPNVEIPPEFSRATLRGAFRNVCSSAEGCPSSLRRQSVQFVARETLGRFVDSDREIIARLPCPKALIGHHNVKLTRSLSLPGSFSFHTNRSIAVRGAVILRLGRPGYFIERIGRIHVWRHGAQHARLYPRRLSVHSQRDRGSGFSATFDPGRARFAESRAV